MIKNALSALVVSLVAGIAGTAAANVVPGEEHCVVNVRADDRLNMREAPIASAPIAARKRYGECGILVTDECRGNWCLVEDGHSLGWVHKRYISVVSPSMYCVTGVTTGDVLNLRAWPSSRSRILTKLNRHQCDIAFLPYSKGSWQKVRVGGWEGWVNRKHLSGQ